MSPFLRGPKRWTTTACRASRRGRRSRGGGCTRRRSRRSIGAWAICTASAKASAASKHDSKSHHRCVRVHRPITPRCQDEHEERARRRRAGDRPRARGTMRSHRCRTTSSAPRLAAWRWPARRLFTTDLRRCNGRFLRRSPPPMASSTTLPFQLVLRCRCRCRCLVLRKPTSTTASSTIDVLQSRRQRHAARAP